MKGRSILENVSLAQEIVQEVDRKVRGGNVILKLDMGKAYDRLEWNFLFQVLHQFGFNSTWINYIKAMFTNCWFSILFNGGVHGYLKSTRGLRQGDPLAPSLFILAEEALSRGISSLYDQGKVVPFHTYRNCPIVSHLLFADDSIIFTNGSKSSLKNWMQFIIKYESSSGQKISRDKSCFIMAKKTTPARASIVSLATGFHRSTLPLQYLGAPLFKGAPKSAYFQALVDKVRKKLASWKTNLLSKGGKITLLQSVLSSIPIYTLSVLSPPVSIILYTDSREAASALYLRKKSPVLSFIVYLA